MSPGNDESRVTQQQALWRAATGALAAGDHPAAMQKLAASITPQDGFQAQARVAKLFASLSRASLGLRPLKMAIVANSTVDHFAEVLHFWLAKAGLAAEIYIAPFDTTTQTVLDPNSALYQFKPELVWLFSTYRDVPLDFAAGSTAEMMRAAIDAAITRTTTLWQPLQDRLNCIVIQNNADIPAHDSFGNMAGAAAWGTRTASRLYNADLAIAATASKLPSSVVVFDLDHLASEFGKARWIDSRYWFHSKHAFSFDAVGFVAHAAAQLIAAAKGLSKKCLVIDLDNTIWGGVIGDDGLHGADGSADSGAEGIRLGADAGAEGEAFVAFQEHIRQLKARGIILAVCSKNDLENAQEPFIKHPDMRLRLADIAVFMANWKSKPDNLREIAATLNIGLDAMVFVDDNPAERELVRQQLPDVAVPEMPDDPALFIQALAAGRHFEVVTLSADDLERTRFYRENAERQVEQNAFLSSNGNHADDSSNNLAAYLDSLAMIGEAHKIDDANNINLPRAAQLINKSNQFHLTGTRYTETELRILVSNQEHSVYCFKLRDRFGDNGLISVVILKQFESALHVDTWVMSCRVLGRTMEEFIFNLVNAAAVERHCKTITGQYIPSAKNKLVSNLYERLGFDAVMTASSLENDSLQSTRWQRAVSTQTSTDQSLHPLGPLQSSPPPLNLVTHVRTTTVSDL